MNVAAPIEIAPQGIGKSSQSQMPAGLRESGSFRSSWQALLASMGANGNGVGDGDSGATSAALKPNGPESPELGKAANLQTQPAQNGTGKHEKEMNDSESSTEKHADVNAKIAKTHTAGSESLAGTDTSLAGMAAIVATAPAFAIPVVSSVSRSKENLADETSGNFQARSMDMQIEGKQQPVGKGGAAHAIANRSPVVAAGGGADSGRTSPREALEMDSAPERTTQALGPHASGDIGSQRNHQGETEEPNPQGSRLHGDQVAGPALASALKEDGSSSPTGSPNSVSAVNEPSIHALTRPQVENPHADNVVALAPSRNQLSNQELQTVGTPGSSLGLNPSLANAPLEPAPAVQTLTTVPIAGKRGSVSSVRGSGHVGTSAAADSNSDHVAPQGSTLIAGQIGNSSLEASRLSRGPGGDSVAENLGRADGEGTANSTSQSGHETFAAMDAGTSAGTPAWVHAGAHQVEAGFQDPALGWVGVRADGSGAGVHAALLPGSADAAVTLGGHLAGLNAYLTEHHMQLEPVTVSAPENHSSGAGFDNSAGQNTQHGAGQGAGQETEPGTQSVVPASVHAKSGLEQGNVVADKTMEPVATHASGGMHISVIA